MYDANDNPTAPSTSFWDIDFDDPNSPYYGVFDKFYVDCPTAPRATTTPTVTTTTTATTTGVTPIESPGYYDSYRYSHQWDFNESPYIGFPVLPGTTKTIIRLWNRIKTAAGEPVTIQVPVEGRLYLYNGEDNELDQTEVTPHLAIVITHNRDEIQFSGNRVRGQEITLTMKEGAGQTLHFIGFPEKPVNFERFSDLLGGGLDRVSRRVRIDGSLADGLCPCCW